MIANNSVTSPRGQFGLILPSTNTTVEAEVQQMIVPGVSWHSGRIFLPNPALDNDESFVAFLEDVRKEIGNTIKSIMTCKPDYLVMGMSAETFWGGKDGAEKFQAHMKSLSGLDVTVGAHAFKHAIDAYGAKTLGMITPYQPVGDEQVKGFLQEMGYNVSAVHGLKCDSATSIAYVDPEEIKAAFRAVDGPDVDALVQAGTNLPAARIAAEMEIELGKPVIAINTATVWHAYRTNGIEDKIHGFGSLLWDH